MEDVQIKMGKRSYKAENGRAILTFDKLNTNYQYQAINGFAFIFPSYMPHRVEENKIDIDRISLSFNYGFLK